MIIREMIIEELRNRGYNAEAQNNIKNGVVFEGIRYMFLPMRARQKERQPF